MITAPTLSCTLEVVGSIASVPMSPQSSVQRAAAGGEQAAGVADVEVDLVGRAVLGGLDVDLERLAEALVVDQRLHVLGVEERALAGALATG